MLSDLEARQIASDWHGGGGSALYALASTGAITDDTTYEIGANIVPRIEHVMDDPVIAGEVADLATLRDYVDHHGPRGPQDGWDSLAW